MEGLAQVSGWLVLATLQPNHDTNTAGVTLEQPVHQRDDPCPAGDGTCSDRVRARRVPLLPQECPHSLHHGAATAYRAVLALTCASASPASAVRYTITITDHAH